MTSTPVSDAPPSSRSASDAPPSSRTAAFLRRLIDAGSAVSAALGVGGEPTERAIRRAVGRFERGGALVFADLEGWPRPPVIHGFVPAAYAVFEDREVILLVEDEAQPDTETELRRRIAFEAWAAEGPEREVESVTVSGSGMRRAVGVGEAE
jgi:hypothetical protein